MKEHGPPRFGSSTSRNPTPPGSGAAQDTDITHITTTNEGFRRGPTKVRGGLKSQPEKQRPMTEITVPKRVLARRASRKPSSSGRVRDDERLDRRRRRTRG